VTSLVDKECLDGSIPAPVGRASARKLSLGTALFGIFFSPKSTFEDIVPTLAWLLPVIILLAVLGLAVAIGLQSEYELGREVHEQQIEKSPAGLDNFARPRAAERADRGGRQVRGHQHLLLVACLRPLIRSLVVALILEPYHVLGVGNVGKPERALEASLPTYVPVMLVISYFLLCCVLKHRATIVWTNSGSPRTLPAILSGRPRANCCNSFGQTWTFFIYCGWWR